MAETETLMERGELKQLLALSKRKPVNCAIGLTKDKDAVVLLDKKAKPRKMAAMLKSECKSKKIELDTASVRFGHAQVDTDIDAALVQFVVNKEAPGVMRQKLLAQLKKSGFQKCEIGVDEGLENAPENEDEGEEQEMAPTAAKAPEAGEPSPAAAQSEAAPEDATHAAAQSAAPEPAPAAQGAAPAQGADLGPIKKRLGDLAKKMMPLLAANPPGADAMKTAARDAQAALQNQDAQGATTAADTLERLLSAAPAAADGAAPPAGGKAGVGSPVFKKASATWVATRKKVEDEIGKLGDEMKSVYKDHPVVGELEKAFKTKVDPIMDKFDSKLSAKLDEVSNATDAATHAKLVQEAKQIIGQYEQFLSTDDLIKALDTNPFVKISIEKTLEASLGALSKALT